MGLFSAVLGNFWKKRQVTTKSSFNPVVWQSWSGDGLWGRNLDIDATRAGYALAQLVNIPLYRAINARMTAFAGLVWELFDVRSGNVVYRSDDYLSEPRLARVVNEESRSLGYNFFALWQMNKCVTGEVYIQKVKNVFDYPASLELLPSLAVTPNVVDGKIKDYVYQVDGKVETLAYDDVVFDRYPNASNPLRGLSPAQVALDSVNVDRNANRFFLAFFRNNASFAKVISAKEGSALTDSDVEFIENWLRENATGVRNSFKTLLSRTPIQIDHQPLPDMTQPLSLVDWYARAVYSAFGVPRSVAGDTDGSRYQASPQDLNWFYLNTVIPEARRIEDVVNTELLQFVDRFASYRFRFDVSAWEMVNESKRRQADRAVALFQAGILTLNEVRAELGYFALEENKLQNESSKSHVCTVRDNTQKAQDVVVVDGHELSIRYLDYDLSLARKEVRAWYKFVRRGGKRDFNYVYTAGDWEDKMRAAHKLFVLHGDEKALQAFYFAVLDAHMSKRHELRKRWLKQVSVKSLGESFEETFANVVSAFLENKLDIATANEKLLAIVADFGMQALEEGAREAGTQVDELLLREYHNEIEKQRIFVYDFLNELREWGAQRSESGELLQDVVARVGIDKLLRAREDDSELVVLLGALLPRVLSFLRDLFTNRLEVWYSNSILQFLQLAQTFGTDDPILEFTGEDGKERCETCQRLKGQRHRKSEWIARGLDPKDFKNRHNFECGLWRCLHYLKQVNAKPVGDW